MPDQCLTSDECRRLLPPNLAPADVVFWTGAGVSRDPPTDLPLGATLTESVVNTYCLPGTWEKLGDYFRKCHMQDAYGNPKPIPRLEAVFEGLLKTGGYEVLRILSPCSTALPNRLHRFLAEHLANGGSHITTNFDTCIERALAPDAPVAVVDSTSTYEARGIPSHRVLAHLHGRFDPSNLSTLGACIRNIAAGLSHQLCQLIQQVMAASRCLVFLGYSGRDYFDVNPFFTGLPDTGFDLVALTVIWVRHSAARPALALGEVKSDVEGYAILDSLRRCGATVHQIEARTSQFVDVLQPMWGMHADDSAPATHSAPRAGSTAQQHLGHEQRVLNTAGLFVHMGIGREVASLSGELLKVAQTRGRDERSRFLAIDFMCSGFRDIGMYRSARTLLTQLPQSNPPEQLYFLHQSTKSWWLSGEYFQAWRGFRNIERMYTIASRGAGSTDLLRQEYLETRVTLLHWYRDTQRLPRPLRWVFPVSLALDAFNDLCDARDAVDRDPHMKTKLVRLYDEIPLLRRHVSVPSWAKPVDTSLASTYAEMDSVLGVINFTRRELLTSIGRGSIPRCEDLRLLLSRSDSIDDRPGLLKCALLLREHCGIVAPGLAECLRHTEWAGWQKLAWRARWLTSGLRTTLRKRRGNGRDARRSSSAA
jgi:hypothetical protein